MTSNEELKDLLINIQTNTRNLNDNMDSVESEIKVIRSENAALKKDISSYSEMISALKAENNVLKNKMIKCEIKIELLINKDRANNIILFKVNDTSKENENLPETVCEISCQAEVTLDPNNIISTQRIGKIPDSRPIIIKFLNPKRKAEIFKKIKNFCAMKIGVSNDLSKEIREKRKILFEKLLVCKQSLGKQGKTTYIKGQYIIMDNKSYDLDTATKLTQSSQKFLASNGNESDDTDDSTTYFKSTASKKRVRLFGPKVTSEENPKRFRGKHNQVSSYMNQQISKEITKNKDEA